MTTHVSYSEITSFRTCPHKHRLDYKERWQPERASPPLEKGRLIHQVLEQHYNRLFQAQIGSLLGLQLTPSTDELLTNAEALWADSEWADLCRWIYRGYLEQYGLDSNWHVMQVEGRHTLWLPTAWGTRSHTQLVMVVDLVVRDELDRIWLVDHKSGIQLPSEFELDLDDQFSLYQWGLTKLGYNVHGVIYNAIRTQQNKGFMLPETRFMRLPLYRTPQQLENTAIDAWRTARRAYALKLGEEDRAFGTVPCMRPYRCVYADACLWARKGGDEGEFLRSSGFTTREEREAKEAPR